MKVIFAVWNRSATGKSGTLRSLAQLLVRKYPTSTVLIPNEFNIAQISDRDFRFVIEINGKIIGIESQGDPNTGLERRLTELCAGIEGEFKPCDIIVCAGRTRGSTVRAIDKVAVDYGYSVVWSSTYQVGDEFSKDEANNLKAQHILEFLEKFCLA